MANKYLPGGALNPIWCNEQDAELLKESIFNIFENLIDGLDINLNLEPVEGVNISISNINRKSNEMCAIINTEDDYEAKFNFIKSHSETPEDLKLAREIIGLE